MATRHAKNNGGNRPPLGSSEEHTRIIKAALKELGKHCGSIGRWCRNEVGVALNQRTEEPMPYGLVVGSSDIVGFIGPTATFCGFEVKTGNAVQSEQQNNFEKMVKRFGGYYFVIRDEHSAVYMAQAAYKDLTQSLNKVT